MSTVLVPLDETAFAESILPDAQQLAGPGGRLILVSVLAHRGSKSDQSMESDNLELYLTNEAAMLESKGIQVTTQVLVGADIPHAIDEGVTKLGAEMVAVSTHGTGHGGRLARSSVAWKTLAHSPVPVLFRHTEATQDQATDDRGTQNVTIMVPLDGSARAEQAVSLATELASQWQGTLLLVQSVDDPTEGQAYLDQVAGSLTVPVKTALGRGKASEALATLAGQHGVTHVVMTSHGRTGLSRVVAGDVAADLIERLPLPIVVIPSLVAAVQQPDPSASNEQAPDSNPRTVPA